MDDMQKISADVKSGFDNVYMKIDTLQDAFTSHKEVCIGHFASINQQIAVDKAITAAKIISDQKIGCLKDKAIADNFDWGKWFVRGTLGIMAIKVIVGPLISWVSGTPASPTP